MFDRDKFNCIIDSISGQVNAHLSRNFKSDEQIAEEAGVSLRQARARLYVGVKKGDFEVRRVFEYRIKPKQKGEK